MESVLLPVCFGIFAEAVHPHPVRGSASNYWIPKMLVQNVVGSKRVHCHLRYPAQTSRLPIPSRLMTDGHFNCHCHHYALENDSDAERVSYLDHCQHQGYVHILLLCTQVGR